MKSDGKLLPPNSNVTDVLVNDMHSGLNPTVVKKIVVPKCLRDLTQIIHTARMNGEKLCIAGGRHAMGGQQFAEASTLIDMTGLNKVLDFDRQEGRVELQAGILWPELISFLQCSQRSDAKQWTIVQKQTGCDGLSIGGALSANMHGRGLTMPPFVNDIEDFVIVMHDGEVLRCSRQNNRELFRLAVGGYGLLGVISSVTLRLIPKTVLQRTVELTSADVLIDALEAKISDGATYGDFQFSIDDKSSHFLNSGILSTYAPIDSVVRGSEKVLSAADWRELLYLAHTDKGPAFATYSKHYLATNGQLYSSDEFQKSTYLEGYHEELDKRLPGSGRGTEVITELYVPTNALSAFLKKCAHVLRALDANLIYGTVRLIEADHETFLPWARQRSACTIFNLHIEHTEAGLSSARNIFQALIQIAITYGGSYYLTYHRYATHQQLKACYPQMDEFLKLKTEFDPGRLFVSEWFRHILATSGN